MRRLLPVLIALLLLPQVVAVVDLLNPEDDHFTNLQTLDFDYYASIPNFQSCTLYIDSQVFPDIDAVSNAMNSVQVQNIAPGTYGWNVTCTGNGTESSEERTFTIDTTVPTLVIVSPDPGTTTDELGIDIIPNDDLAGELTCSVMWLGTAIDEAQVTANTHYVQTYNAPPGTGDLSITCEDLAGNTVTETRLLTLESQLFLTLETDAVTYGIHEPVLLTIDTVPSADVTIDVCPNTGGFVQCTSALLDTSDFPQTVTLPFMNKTGGYIVDGIATHGGNAVNAQVLYDITNTLSIDVDSDNVGLNQTITLTASVTGGASPYDITWLLTNGTVRHGSSTDVRYKNPGEYNITVSVEDDAGNTREIIETITIDPEHDVTFIVVDNTTRTPISGAIVDFSDTEWSTLQDGLAYFTVQDGKHRLFITATGYEYVVEELTINRSRTITYRLGQVSGIPIVTITDPVENGTAGTPVALSYQVQHSEPVTCTLLKASDTNWFVENGTMSVTDSTAKIFLRAYEYGTHTVRIECFDTQGRAGSSTLRTFTLSDELPPAEVVVEEEYETTDVELELQQLKDQVESFVAGLDAYGQDEQQTMELIGFDADLRSLKRTILQGIRDMDDLRFRDDIEDAQKKLERNRIVQRVRDQLAKVPIGIDVRDDKQYSRYVEEEHLDDIFAALVGVVEDSKGLRKTLVEDQQKFTITSKIVQAELAYYDGRTQDITIVTRTFSYANDLDGDYEILEIIPKKVAKDAADLILITDGEILVDDPVLSFPAGQRVVYLINEEVAFHRLEEIHTLLFREEVGNSVTGMAIFANSNFEILGWPLYLSIAIIVLSFLINRFGLLEQLKYLSYKFGKHEQVHYLRVLINDADDQLETKNYEKAEMLYKEVRMTYDTLPDIERNDLYGDVMGLVQKMDSYYFNMVMIELDDHLRAEDIHGAIAAYEKLLGTFERLRPEEQQQLVETVTGLAKRLGVTG